jgi:hypothetical protein
MLYEEDSLSDEYITGPRRRANVNTDRVKRVECVYRPRTTLRVNLKRLELGLFGYHHREATRACKHRVNHHLFIA